MHHSVPPGPITRIAAHESGHRLIRGSNLLHIFAKSVLFVAESTLLACVLVDVFPHFLVKTSPALLQLRQLVLPDVFFRLLVEIQLFVVEGHFPSRYTVTQHLFFSLFWAFSSKAMTDRVDTIVQRFLCLVCMVRYIPSNMNLSYLRTACTKVIVLLSLAASSKLVTKFLYMDLSMCWSLGPLPAMSCSGI